MPPRPRPAGSRALAARAALSSALDEALPLVAAAASTSASVSPTAEREEQRGGGGGSSLVDDLLARASSWALARVAAPVEAALLLPTPPLSEGEAELALFPSPSSSSLLASLHATPADEAAARLAARPGTSTGAREERARADAVGAAPRQGARRGRGLAAEARESEVAPLRRQVEGLARQVEDLISLSASKEGKLVRDSDGREGGGAGSGR